MISIGGKLMKKILMLVCVTALCGITLFAQDLFGQDNDKRISRTVEKSNTHVAAVTPETLTKIYTNLGVATDAYNDDIGWTVSGPENSVIGEAISVAMAFTPASNSTVTEVQLAIGYAEGDNQVNIALYNDSGSNTPGTLIDGPVTVKKLPDFGTCCKLATAKFPSGASVTAGSQYWVVAEEPTSGTGSDTWVAWSWVNLPNFLFAGNDNGAGWVSTNTTVSSPPPAGSVLGTVP